MDSRRGSAFAAHVIPSVMRGDFATPDGMLEEFHESSSLYRSSVPRFTTGPAARMFRDGLDPADLGEPVLGSGGPESPLPVAARPSGLLADALEARTSFREFRGAPADLDQLSALLHWSLGAKPDPDLPPGRARRRMPSAGALYPLEAIVLIRQVRGIDPGVYRYGPARHTMEVLPGADVLAMIEATYSSELIRDSAFTVVLAGAAWRSRAKYGDRGYRYALMEAGHAGQNLVLVAPSVSLRGLTWNAFYDREFNHALGLDGTDLFALYLASFEGASR